MTSPNTETPLVVELAEADHIAEIRKIRLEVCMPSEDDTPGVRIAKCLIMMTNQILDLADGPYNIEDMIALNQLVVDDALSTFDALLTPAIRKECVMLLARIVRRTSELKRRKTQ